MRKDIEDSKDQVLVWIEENRPKIWICRKLDCRPRTLDGYLSKWGISYKGNMGERGFKKSPYKKPSTEWTSNKFFCPSSRLRRRLIEEGVKKEMCEECQNTHWRGNPIPLDLHHLDGDRFNNSLENLQILCKNCHALTETYSKKKK